MKIKSEIEKQLVSNFVYGDNFLNNFNETQRINHNNLASILIDRAIETGSNQMNVFLRKVAEGAKFKLPFPIKISKKIDCIEGKRRWKKEVDFEYKYFYIKEKQLVLENPTHYFLPTWRYLNKHHYENMKKKAYESAMVNFANISTYDLFAKYSSFDTPEKTIRFWGEKLLLKGYCLDKTVPKIEHLGSVRTVDDFLTYFFLFSRNIDYIIDNEFGDWHKIIYTFKNEDGEPVQYVIKQLWHDKAEKSLITCSAWLQTKTAQSKILPIPMPGLQILYNLDLISNTDKAVIVLTDSLELAESNQRNAPDNVVWTSWVGDEDKFDGVDWTALKSADTIYYLITNHSGVSLAEAYVKAERLAEYLAKEHDLQLEFTQLQVDYQKAPVEGFDTFEEMLAYRNDSQPCIEPDSLIFHEDKNSFEEMCIKAKEFLKAKPDFWDSKDIQEETEDKESTVKNGLKAINYLSRPGIVRGDASMLLAPPKHCKTVLNFSLCASIISRKKLFSNKWWTVPTSDYKWNKVLYLDFEMGEERFENCKPKFIYPYFPSDSQQKQECEDNFIHKDLKGDSTDYSDPKNEQKILDKIEDAKNRGIKGQPIDLLVIDTYTKFVKCENLSTWSKIETLINKIISQGIAVLIVHHSDDTGKSKGYSEKLKSLAGQIIITMDEKDIKKKNAEDFRNIYIHENRDSHVGVDNEPFKINYKNGKWNAYKTEKNEKGEYLNVDSTQEFKEITDAYKVLGHPRDEVLKMLDIGKSQYSKLRKTGGK